MSDKTLTSTIKTIKKKYKQPMGCYSCIHFKWIDNPNPTPGVLMVPSCLKGYDGIMLKYFRLNQSKSRGPNLNHPDGHLTDASNPSCMMTELHLHDLDDTNYGIEYEEE